ncbi:MAG: hypothetical protein K2P17_01495 [Helicobacteraceae bacterium]|nr:hypothetical protein [Helicobacteraceae bacterium]
MKKESVSLHLMIKKELHNKLKQQATLNNQSMTKYLEDCISKKEKYSKKTIRIIDDIKNIINIHIKSYNGLNSAISNLNQLNYNLYVNELPTSDEIIDIIELVKNCTIENKQITKEIINKLNEININSNLESTTRYIGIEKQNL